MKVNDLFESSRIHYAVVGDEVINHPLMDADDAVDRLPDDAKEWVYEWYLEGHRAISPEDLWASSMRDNPLGIYYVDSEQTVYHEDILNMAEDYTVLKGKAPEIQKVLEPYFITDEKVRRWRREKVAQKRQQERGKR